MKTRLFLHLALAALIFFTAPAFAQLITHDQGATTLTVRSGGTLQVLSGGTLQLDSGSTLTSAATNTISTDITLATAKALQTDTTTAHTALLKAYDVDGTAYKTFATLTNANTPSLAIAAPSGGTVTIDGAAIGGTTPAAGTFTTLNATTLQNNSVTQPVLRTAVDAVASGQTSKAVTVTGVTAASRCVASPNEVPTNAVYIKSVAPGTDTVTVTTSGDPGASNLDLTVICAN